VVDRRTDTVGVSSQNAEPATGSIPFSPGVWVIDAIRQRWWLLPWWARVIVVAVAARLVSTVFLLILAAQQPASFWTGAQPDYFSFANFWDAAWYQRIVTHGYPTTLPLKPDGTVAESAWAFLPIYPVIVNALTLTGLPWNTASVIIAVAAGFGAALVFYRLLIRYLTEDQALYGVLLFQVAPVSVIMQLGYAESLTFLLIAASLLLFVTRQWGWLMLVVTVWSFTRPGSLAFALTLGLYWFWRFFTRRTDEFSWSERGWVALSAFVAGATGLAWSVVAWIRTGSPSAYLDTELAWRSSYIGDHDFVPFTPWFQSGVWWGTNQFGWSTTFSIVAVATLAVLWVVVLAQPVLHRTGREVWLWLGCYSLYLFAVFFPQSSTFRLLAPLFPLVGVLALPRNRWYRGFLVILFLVLQWWWLTITWVWSRGDWTPP